MPKRHHPAPPKWTKEHIREAVDECNHSLELLKHKYPGAYTAIRKMDMIEHFFGKKRVCKRRTIEETAQECSKYQSTSELRKTDRTLYEYITHKKWQNICFKHMKRPKDKRIAESFTWEDILDKIKLCDKLKELRENYTSEYRAALRNPEWKTMLYKMLPSRKKSSNVQ